MKRTIGGDRLGQGNKMKVDLKTYERSTHDLGYIWRSTMAAGTLVPFMVEVGLPGDSFDINLNCDIKTHPTVGPLFGSYKVQLDVFQCPIRIYQGQLHNNKLGIGLDMSKVKLPQMHLTAALLDRTKDPDNQQINPSSIFKYLNISGLGRAMNAVSQEAERNFNAIPYLAYWDIYKNYYANKQEEIGVVIHNELEGFVENVDQVEVFNVVTGLPIVNLSQGKGSTGTTLDRTNTIITILVDDATEPDMNNIIFYEIRNGIEQETAAYELFNSWEWNGGATVGEGLIGAYRTVYGWDYINSNSTIDTEPKLVEFPLENLDTMREDILAAVKNTAPFMINKSSLAPYGLALESKAIGSKKLYSKMSSQEGLAIKTYQSDLFNNWLSTEWIDGENGINAITAIDTSEGSFNIDTLNLSKKVYDMLNRIAISGGSYDDWLDTVYTHERYQRAESPMYMGGLIKELVFQEVVSNAESENIDGGKQPLGTLAGKGGLSRKHKGGRITIKVDEPCYIIGIVSLTPRIDYSQGNKWDVNLKTMDDFHKPALDQIGFQDLITDQMAYFDTAAIDPLNPTLMSAGKQPAWINYMTNVNQVKGNFAIDHVNSEGGEMFMTLNRKYEIDKSTGRLKDLTTYIDPVKFNNIFAYSKRDAQNFWTQIGLDITARRKMSAKIMPNL